MSELSVQVSKYDEELAAEILKDIDMNINTAINTLFNQIISDGGIPFEVKNLEFSKELLESLEEGKQILKDMEEGKRKGYRSIKELMDALLSD